ncbi:hypothetical protein D3C86_1374300 [compost metagenome]
MFREDLEAVHEGLEALECRAVFLHANHTPEYSQDAVEVNRRKRNEGKGSEQQRCHGPSRDFQTNKRPQLPEIEEHDHGDRRGDPASRPRKENRDDEESRDCVVAGLTRDTVERRGDQHGNQSDRRVEVRIKVRRVEAIDMRVSQEGDPEARKKRPEPC